MHFLVLGVWQYIRRHLGKDGLDSIAEKRETSKEGHIDNASKSV